MKATSRNYTAKLIPYPRFQFLSLSADSSPFLYPFSFCQTSTHSPFPSQVLVLGIMKKGISDIPDLKALDMPSDSHRNFRRIEEERMFRTKDSRLETRYKLMDWVRFRDPAICGNQKSFCLDRRSENFSYRTQRR
jgi:hypothetical protein